LAEQGDNEVMALAPSHLPKASKAGAARRVRPFLTSRRHRPERLDRRDPLTTPSDVAYQAAGIHRDKR